MIYDSRPFMNAGANKFKGGGYEDCGVGANYSNCRLMFCDIDNIHAVRGSFEKMSALSYTARDMKAQTWLKQLDETGYRQILQAILIATN